MSSTPAIHLPATHCSFCIKPAPEVSKLIAGPGVYICDECVQICINILAQAQVEAAQPPPEIPDWSDMDDQQILDRLPAIAAVSTQVDLSLQALVDLLRERRVAWSRIGAALGVTRQTVWERYSTTQ
ncbi:hypothetical protein KGA66_10335 [Actinocrinis puniceicyclus]|uniref:ClpX-type ZB domain-containing protein n=1 Tax=Actinocrinis puniceicyclus TaxID=977794 RepID=A0A8J8BCE5_9ACTN|nr:hypothetical protein [Actinocrinis puniceicyclus]